MKALLQTLSESWAESVKIALEANGIPAVVLDQQAPGYLPFAGRFRVAVVNDTDLPRAQAVVRSLQPVKSGPPPSWWWHKRGLVAFGAGFVLLVLAAATSGSQLPHVIALALFVAGAVALVAGFVLFFRGYRADKSAAVPAR